MKAKVLYFVTEDWYFCSHRMPLAQAAGKAGFDIVVVTRVGEDEDRIRNERFRLHPICLRRGVFSPVNDIVALVRLIRILRMERPQIVHNVALKPILLGTLAARLTAIPAIVNAFAGLGHVFITRDVRVGWLRRSVVVAFRFLLRRKNIRVIVQNDSDRDLVQSLGVPAKRIALIAGSGVETSAFQPLPEVGGPIVVAMVSRMLWDKGTGDLVEAARLVRQQGYEIFIRLVGPTDPDNPTSIPESTLKGWVEDGIVEWPGPTRDVAAVWKNAHIGVLPSYREGLPKSLLEAAACGRALIATDVPGCRDVVIHEKTGLLIPPRDPEALAKAIIRLASDPELRARLGKAARARVERHFSVEKVVEETLTLYRSILAAA